MARPRSQLDRIERQVSKIGAHVYGGIDPDNGEPVVSHRERLDKIDSVLLREEGAKKWGRVKGLVREGLKTAAAVAAGFVGGRASQ